MWLCTVICIIYGFLSSFCWNLFILMRLRKTHHALQLPMFFFFSFFFLFFCQTYPGLWNCKLVFLILIVWQYVGSRRWVHRFQGIHVRIDIRINISISIRPMITKFGKQVQLEDLTQMSLIKQVLGPHYINITWQTNNIISPLPECLWPINLAGW